MDFTHIRWFTKTTIIELFKSCGFQIVEAGGRILEEPERDRALLGITAMAEAMGANVEDAAFNATPFQWVVRATLA
jgi:citrate lyase synthetase